MTDRTDPAIDVRMDHLPDDFSRIERIVGPNDLRPARMLQTAARVSDAVGRVVVRGANQSVLGWGTGALVGSNLLLTNAHVFPDAVTASNSSVEFNFHEWDERTRVPVGDIDEYLFDPDSFFAVSPYRKESEGGPDAEHLDFALVAVTRGAEAVARWGTVPLTRDTSQVGLGSDVFIVQHPGGWPKLVAYSSNHVVVERAYSFFYVTDTEGGSSGSPVFDADWRMVGLHHAGGWYDDGPGTSRFFANEAIRLSLILDDLGDRVTLDLVD